MGYNRQRRLMASLPVETPAPAAEAFVEAPVAEPPVVVPAPEPPKKPAKSARQAQPPR